MVLFRVAYFNRFYSLLMYPKPSVLEANHSKINLDIGNISYKYFFFFFAVTFPKSLFKFHVYFSPDNFFPN